jgi:hypothetical protein
MSDEKGVDKGAEPVRVIDRRTFTADGDRRHPDAVQEEAVPVLAPPPRPDPPRSEPARDPVTSAHFQNLVVNLARQAAANLGAARHPLTGQIEVDLEGAQQMIDLLQALRQKTQGNLAADEKDLLEGLIGDLQMQFVAVRSKSSAKP